MKTGARFWKLIGMVILILSAYGLMELFDAIKARNSQLGIQQQLLLKQRILLHDNHWVADLAAIDLVRQAWLAYLPSADSVAVAKAQLLNDMRSLAQNSGLTNLSVTATEVDENEKSNTASSYNSGLGSTSAFSSSYKKSDTEAPPKGVHLIKVKLGGRFDPAVFTKLLRALEEGRFTIVESASVRGTQMELNLRYYWQMNLSKAAVMPENTGASLKTANH